MTGDEIPLENLFSDEMEMAALGSMFLSRSAAYDVIRICEPSDFYRRSHSEIMEAAINLSSRNAVVDLVSLSEQLGKDGVKRCGGENYLTQLAEFVPSPSNSVYYATEVRKYSELRTQLKLADEVRRLVAKGENPALIAEVLRQSNAGHPKDEVRSASARDICIGIMSELDDLIESGCMPPGVYTGFADLDARLGPMEPGSVNVIGARPSVGKSALAIGIALNLARSGCKPYLASLEMPRRKIAKRLVTMQTGISSQVFRNPETARNRYSDVSEGVETLYGLPFQIDDRASSTVASISHEVARSGGCGCLVVDYVQIMGGGAEWDTNRRITDRMVGLRVLAKEMNIPVIILSQLNRELERREQKRPQLADLRDSGSLEAEADTVMLMYRPEYHERLSNPSKFAASEIEPVEIIVAKNRDGETGTAVLAFQSRFARFSSLSRDAVSAYWNKTHG